MWLDRQHGIIKVVNAHKRGQSRRHGVNSFHLYHWGKPCMLARPADWRDNDGNAFGFKEDGLQYIGNIFDMLPFATLAGQSVVSESGGQS